MDITPESRLRPCSGGIAEEVPEAFRGQRGGLAMSGAAAAAQKEFAVRVARTRAKASTNVGTVFGGQAVRRGGRHTGPRRSAPAGCQSTEARGFVAPDVQHRQRARQGVSILRASWNVTSTCQHCRYPVRMTARFQSELVQRRAWGSRRPVGSRRSSRRRQTVGWLRGIYTVVGSVGTACKKG